MTEPCRPSIVGFVLAASPHRTGLLYGLSAYLIWGVLPLYFKALAHVSAGEILAHRILWSLILLLLVGRLLRRGPALAAALKAPRVAAILALTAALIAINWLVYIHAVVSGHVLEGSLGYYLNPLFNVLLGVVLLKERLSRPRLAAVGIAAVGVAVLAAGAGSALWISLTLAFSFGLYGFVRKVAPVEALEGLAVETLLLAPLALSWLVYLTGQGQFAFGANGWGTAALLALGGAATAAPLLLFTAAARLLPYSTLGFLQFVAPSLQFLLAVLVFGETLTRAHLICFGLIWFALLIFTLDLWRVSRQPPAQTPMAPGPEAKQTPIAPGPEARQTPMAPGPEAKEAGG